jgi:UDP-glucuronate 4-epimerase
MLNGCSIHRIARSPRAYAADPRRPSCRRNDVSDERTFLVTGALGFIGAWTVRALVRRGSAVVGLDMASDPRRLRLVMSDEELRGVTLVTADITDLAAIEGALDEHRITDVIHLAALQVPFCRADPPLGARVNVVGTVNVFDAVARRSDRIKKVVYTSSIGMFDAGDADPATHRLEADATPHPTNHYGVYKQANEGTARVYWLDNGLSSTGLRPLTVYGPGRDQGLTSTPTTAILSAVLGRPYAISFGGRTQFQYAEDVAETLILAARSPLEGAHVLNLGGSAAHMADFVAAIEAAVPEAAGTITFPDEGLPFPEQIDSASLAALGPVPVTPLIDGVRASVELFRERLRTGVLEPEPASVP